MNKVLGNLKWSKYFKDVMRNGAGSGNIICVIFSGKQEVLVMVKKIDNFKIYKKAFVGLTAGVLIVGILGGVHISVFVKFNTIICIIRLRVLVLLKN